jgi:hypothetical protein
MRQNASRGDSHETALQRLLRAIVSRDHRTVSRLLAEAPQLARLAITAGASREMPAPYFFEEIAHYVYAGDTALHVAAAAYEREIAEELVSRGANVSARNRRGAEPLHYSADGIPGSDAWDPDAQYAVVEFLVGAGADPNSQDKSGVAPLHRAVRTRCTAAVRALLANETDPVKRNKSGSTPLHLAIQNTGRSSAGTAIARDEQEKIIRLLLDHGARPSDKDASGKSVEDSAQADWIHSLLRET